MRRLLALALWLLPSSAFAQSALSNLSAGTAISGTDLFYDVQTVGVGGVKVTGTQFATFMSTATMTFTNKTFDTGGSGNSFKINGNAITGISGNTATVATVTGSLTSGDCLKADASGNVETTGSACSSGGTPGGSNTQVQYNNSSSFGGISGATTNGTALTFASGDLLLSGSSSGTVTLNAPSTGGGTLTLPAGSATVAALSVAQTWSAAQTFDSSDFLLAGSSTGSTTINAAATASGTLTLPAATDTLTGRATTDTLTNKTITSSTDSLGGVTAAFGSDAKGDIYTNSGSSNVIERLAVGSTGQLLTVASGLPSWASNITIEGTLTTDGSIISTVRSSSSSTVTVSATTDYFLCLDPTSNAIAVDLPSSPATGLTYLIKDCTGQASTHNITITPASGNVDGSSTFVMSTAYQSVGVTYTGSQWSIN